MTAASKPSTLRPDLVLTRHGETEWTISGQHTSRTEVPLTDVGREHAKRLADRFATRRFALVLTSPRERAVESCRLAGLGDIAERTEDVAEWNYGAYEGRTTTDIRAERPGWSLWRDGVPDGETAAHVAARADRVITRVRGGPGDAVVFSHGHFLRVLAARWLALPPSEGRLFSLAPGSISVLGWEREQPVVSWWNEVVG